MKSLFKRFLKDNSGATAIEYGIIAAITALAIIGGTVGMKDKLTGVFTSINTGLPAAATTP